MVALALLSKAESALTITRHDSVLKGDPPDHNDHSHNVPDPMMQITPNMYEKP
ncbi:MAG: hypothetical protein OEY86_13235 [Nitrospira sp.]|nr:hypothetical protein [Nitrospira sp.]